MTLIDAAIYERCLEHYAAVREEGFVVKDAIPIPYFGDLDAYLASPIRVVTAALNPSNIEFPPSHERPRFNVANGLSGPEELEQELGLRATVRSDGRTTASSFVSATHRSEDRRVRTLEGVAT